MPRRNSRRNYKIPVKIIANCALVLAAGGILFLLLKAFFVKYPYFNITRVSICGTDERPFVDFKRRLIGKNIFSLDLITLKKQIEQEFTGVQCTLVQRRPPGDVLFFLKKRIPVAQLKLLRYHLVDSQAQIMPYASDFAFADLPVISGLQDNPKGGKSYPQGYPRLHSAVELIREKNNHPSLGVYKITRIHISADKAGSLYLSESPIGEAPVKNASRPLPVEVKFDPERPSETLRLLALLLKKRPLQAIEYIDLKNVNSPVILEKKEK